MYEVRGVKVESCTVGVCCTCNKFVVARPDGSGCASLRWRLAGNVLLFITVLRQQHEEIC
jgi:hypothetical protein